MPPRIRSTSSAGVRPCLLLAMLLVGVAVTPLLEHRIAAAQQAGGAGPGRFLAVKAWRLTWNSQSTQTSAIRNGQHSASGTAVLTLDDEAGGAGIVESEGMWSGTGPVNASGVFHEDRGTAGKHREGSGSTSSRAELGVDVSQGTYSFHVYCDDPVIGNAYDWRPGSPRRTYTDSIPVLCPGIDQQRLPTGGLALGGSVVHRNEADGIVVAADPGILTKAAQQRPAGSGGRSQTVSEVVKQFEAAGPGVVGAITGAGVTPRDFIVSQWAIAQAGVGVQMAKSGIALPDTINKDNVAFAQKHEAALMAVMAEMQKLRKQ